MRFILNSRFVTTWRLAIAGHVVHRSRQGRAHEPIREFRTAETQSLSHLVPTDPGRVQGCWCPSWTTRTDLPIETIRTFQSRHLVTTSLAFADRQRDEAEDNSIAYIHYALIHGFTTASQALWHVSSRDCRVCRLTSTAAMHHCASNSFSS